MWKHTVNAGGPDGVVDPDVDEQVGGDVGQERTDQPDEHGLHLSDHGASSWNVLIFLPQKLKDDFLIIAFLQHLVFEC
jgi:hypothetical protein